MEKIIHAKVVKCLLFSWLLIDHKVSLYLFTGEEFNFYQFIVDCLKASLAGFQCTTSLRPIRRGL